MLKFKLCNTTGLCEGGYNTMMTEPPKSDGSEEVCPICNKPKSNHTPEQMLECSKKIRDFYDAKEDDSKK